jgi:hypothetical protein
MAAACAVSAGRQVSPQRNWACSSGKRCNLAVRLHANAIVSGNPRGDTAENSSLLAETGSIPSRWGNIGGAVFDGWRATYWRRVSAPRLELCRQTQSRFLFSPTERQVDEARNTDAPGKATSGSSLDDVRRHECERDHHVHRSGAATVLRRDCFRVLAPATDQILQPLSPQSNGAQETGA